MSGGGDYLGRDVQVPGGSRYTRAGGLWLGEKELDDKGMAVLLLTMIMMVLMVIWQR